MLKKLIKSLSGRGLQKLIQAISSVTKPKARKYSNYRARFEDDRIATKESLR